MVYSCQILKLVSLYDEPGVLSTDATDLLEYHIVHDTESILSGSMRKISNARRVQDTLATYYITCLCFVKFSASLELVVVTFVTFDISNSIDIRRLL